MKKIFVMMFALTLGMGAANAQEVTNAETVETTEQATKVSLCKEIYPDAGRTATSITVSRASSRSTA